MSLEREKDSPSPYRSALHGFIAQVPPGSRYAIYPLGNYTRGCLADLELQSLTSDDRVFVGFIDDAVGVSEYQGYPVLSLDVAATEWSLDAIILTRDTTDGALATRIQACRNRGLLSSVRIVDLPEPTVEAMSSHLGAYHPGCVYPVEFQQVCQQRDSEGSFDSSSDSTLICTMDGELHPGATKADADLFAVVMQELCLRMKGAGYTLSLCVQLEDTPGVGLATPEAVIQTVLDAFGPDAIELHGLNHEMPVEGYDREWFDTALSILDQRYGVRCRYWAPPGWNLNWRTLGALRDVPQIRVVRGFWSGVSCWQSAISETFRFPYRVGSILQFPYSYVDWRFMDISGARLDSTDICDPHRRLAKFASGRACLLETIGHPFRFIGSDYRERLAVFSETLDIYRAAGVKIIDAATALQRCEILDDASINASNDRELVSHEL